MVDHNKHICKPYVFFCMVKKEEKDDNMKKECDKWCQIWHKICACGNIIHKDDKAILFFTNNIDGLMEHIGEQRYQCMECYEEGWYK